MSVNPSLLCRTRNQVQEKIIQGDVATSQEYPRMEQGWSRSTRVSIWQPGCSFSSLHVSRRRFIPGGSEVCKHQQEHAALMLYLWFNHRTIQVRKDPPRASNPTFNNTKILTRTRTGAQVTQPFPRTDKSAHGAGRITSLKAPTSTRFAFERPCSAFYWQTKLLPQQNSRGSCWLQQNCSFVSKCPPPLPLFICLYS